MYETGKDLNAKYCETSRGGLAIKVQCDDSFAADKCSDRHLFLRLALPQSD